MHENQRIVNDMIALAKEKLSYLNDKDFSMDEVWDFIKDIVSASYDDKAKKTLGKKEDAVDKVFEEWSKK